jgi:hypothetical protein
MTTDEEDTLDKLRQATQMLASTSRNPIREFWDSYGRHDRQPDGKFKLVTWAELDEEAGPVVGGAK